ncbi:MAG TPA: YihY/virulence factor BrkB family protein [Candidatus Acidoferrum sp.]|nr:YihY/virulence factor BrkB family protein [Candidatus Acidoferrum sp.]
MRSTIKSLLKEIWTEIRADDVFGRAAQLAYFFLLALFPFLICIIATLSVFGVADKGRAVLFRLFADVLPPVAYQLIITTFRAILRAGGPLKMSAGMVASVWSASYGMSAIMDTLNAAYKVHETRSIVKQYFVAIALTIGMGLLIVISTLCAVIGTGIVRRLALPHAIWLAWTFAKWPVAVGLLLLAFAITYYFAPDLKQRNWHWISPGAIAGVLLLLFVLVGVRVYLHFAGNYTATYGSLSGVIVLMLCFWLGGIAVLSGGVLNGVVERAKTKDHLQP